jgi:membrane protease YdiL (CAAX protease family)
VVIHSQESTARSSGRTGIRGSITRHPLVWFFTLANLFSWAAWTPYILSENGLGILHFGFPAVLGTTQFAGVLPGAYLGPITSAFLVTAIADGRDGLRVWAGRLRRWRVRPRWYLTVLLGVPAVLTVTSLALSHQNVHLPSVAILAAYLPALVVQMLTTGIAEEPGWRDFALPRLQRRFGPMIGTLVLGVLWGVWHLPLFLTSWGNWPHVTWTTPVEFVASCIAFSFVMTWVFNVSGESLPLAIVLHAGINTYFSIAWSGMFPDLASQDTTNALLLASAVVGLTLLAVTKGRLGYRPQN